MRNVNKIVFHNSYTSQSLDFFKTLNSFNNTHKKRLHDKYGQPISNTDFPHIAYHFCVGADGLIMNTRNLEDVGYHASNLKVNQESIGVCVMGKLDIEFPTDKQYEACKQIIKDLQDRYGTLGIYPHSYFCS